MTRKTTPSQALAGILGSCRQAADHARAHPSPLPSDGPHGKVTGAGTAPALRTPTPHSLAEAALTDSTCDPAQGRDSADPGGGTWDSLGRLCTHGSES